MTELATEGKVYDAEKAALALAATNDEERSSAVEAIARELEHSREQILAANETDVEAAEAMLAAGEYSQALVDRLALSDTKIDGIVEMVRSVAEQNDPLGQITAATRLDDGLTLYKRSVPIGVVGSVFESRPDALVQIAALCLKSGNAVILKGGSEASETNRLLFQLIESATKTMPSGWAQQIEAREDVDTLLAMDNSIDLLMPRGSTEFVQYMQDNTSIPVLGHADGICHVYVDKDADISMAADIAFDAKVQYPAVCNAVETLLVHESIAEEFLPVIAKRYAEAGVEMRGDTRARSYASMNEATEEDWTTEYGDLIVSIAVVDSLSEAINHITTFGSKHTEAIVTESTDRAHQFRQGLDSSSVFHNASTRFADGYRFGLGAEVGISTGKIHARGPVGLTGLTTYQYALEGNGHLVSTYAGEDAKPFTHEQLDLEDL